MTKPAPFAPRAAVTRPSPGTRPPTPRSRREESSRIYGMRARTRCVGEPLHPDHPLPQDAPSVHRRPHAGHVAPRPPFFSPSGQGAEAPPTRPCVARSAAVSRTTLLPWSIDYRRAFARHEREAHRLYCTTLRLKKSQASVGKFGIQSVYQRLHADPGAARAHRSPARLPLARVESVASGLSSRGRPVACAAAVLSGDAETGIARPGCHTLRHACGG